MIVWSEHLYIGEQVGKNVKKLQKKLEAGKIVPDIFLITKPSNEKNLFDILLAAELFFPYYKRQTLVVYALAKGRAEAEQLLVTIIEDVYRTTGGLYPQTYFKEGSYCTAEKTETANSKRLCHSTGEHSVSEKGVKADSGNLLDTT